MRQRKIKNTKLDPHRKQSLDERNKVAMEKQPELAQLEARLLGIEGEAVVLRSEPDLEKILSRGEVRNGKGARIGKGMPNGCHENSAAYYDEHRGEVSIMTGFALSNDGIWRQHSWLIENKIEQIIETTVCRSLYYGFKMTDDEAEGFVLNQFLPHSADRLSQYSIEYAIALAEGKSLQSMRAA